jgi:L-arabinokinase
MSVNCVVFYISGHGFGHASRDIEVINALLRREASLDIHVRTAAARWLFDLAITGTVTVHPVQCDTGAAQIDALTLDESETIRQAADFHRNLDTKASHEAETLGALGADVVVGDIPPLAFAAAARAGVVSAALGNFTWDWIYEGYPEHLRREPELVPSIRNAYRRADRLWRLPLSGGFEGYARVIDVPFIARHARRPAADVRAKLGVPDERRLVVSSFGGHDAAGLQVGGSGDDRRYTYVTTGPGRSLPRTKEPHVVHVNEREWYGSGFRYEDLVAAADAVVSKPGYGIIAECIANRTALLYTSRGRFPEYEVLVREMPRFVRCRFLQQPDLLAGRWAAALDALLDQPEPPERPPTDGAEVIADLILALR